MKKLVSIALILALVFSLAATAMAAEGVTLKKEKDSWFIVVTNGYVGTVTYKDNKKAYTYDVYGNGKYEVGLQRSFTGQLTLVGTYDAPEAPYIVGTRTKKTTQFDGYAGKATFLAKQSDQSGNKSNYVEAVITETYTTVEKVYDIWSNGIETLRETKYCPYHVEYSGRSNALPNGSRTDLPVTFANGLGGYSMVVTYTGNGDTFTWIVNAPVHETVIHPDEGVYF